MAISKGTTKGPRVSVSRANQGPNFSNKVGGGPSAGPRGGKKMPHHGATGTRVVAKSKGKLKIGGY